MTFPVLGIPSSTDVPSQSQGQIQTNFNSIIGWGAVDHVGYGSVNAGTHSRITFPTISSQSVGAGTSSILYTVAGTAKSGSPQLFWQNQDTTLQVSGIRAWGFCTSSGVSNSQSVNVSSVTNPQTGVFNVVLTSGAVQSDKFAVNVSATMNGPPWTGGVLPGYVITGVGTFTLNFHALIGNNGVNPTNFSFFVMQL